MAFSSHACTTEVKMQIMLPLVPPCSWQPGSYTCPCSIPRPFLYVSHSGVGMVGFFLCSMLQDEGEWGAVPSPGGGAGVLLFPVTSTAELTLRADCREAADRERPQGTGCMHHALPSLGPDFLTFLSDHLPSKERLLLILWSQLFVCYASYHSYMRIHAVSV